ncbi:MAG: hypothetical protein AAFV25_08795, partial [Bacteroidota bacterium]
MIRKAAASSARPLSLRNETKSMDFPHPRDRERRWQMISDSQKKYRPIGTTIGQQYSTQELPEQIQYSGIFLR